MKAGDIVDYAMIGSTYVGESIATVVAAAEISLVAAGVIEHQPGLVSANIPDSIGWLAIVGFCSLYRDAIRSRRGANDSLDKLQESIKRLQEWKPSEAYQE